MSPRRRRRRTDHKQKMTTTARKRKSRGNTETHKMSIKGVARRASEERKEKEKECTNHK